MAAFDMLPGGLELTFLPAIGSIRRNPTFWSDAEVRRLAISHHRQMTVEQSRALIRASFGDARTPSKSALARVWKRLDVAIAAARLRPVRRAR